jgi:hypothetical protein
LHGLSLGGEVWRVGGRVLLGQPIEGQDIHVSAIDAADEVVRRNHRIDVLARCICSHGLQTTAGSGRRPGASVRPGYDEAHAAGLARGAADEGPTALVDDTQEWRPASYSRDLRVHRHPTWPKPGSKIMITQQREGD